MKAVANNNMVMSKGKSSVLQVLLITDAHLTCTKTWFLKLQVVSNQRTVLSVLIRKAVTIL